MPALTIPHSCAFMQSTCAPSGSLSPMKVRTAFIAGTREILQFRGKERFSSGSRELIQVSDDQLLQRKCPFGLPRRIIHFTGFASSSVSKVRGATRVAVGKNHPNRFIVVDQLRRVPGDLGHESRATRMPLASFVVTGFQLKLCGKLQYSRRSLERSSIQSTTPNVYARTGSLGR